MKYGRFARISHDPVAFSVLNAHLPMHNTVTSPLTRSLTHTDPTCLGAMELLRSPSKGEQASPSLQTSAYNLAARWQTKLVVKVSEAKNLQSKESFVSVTC